MIGVECKGKQSQRVRVILYLPVISRLQVVPYRLKRIARYDPLVGVHDGTSLLGEWPHLHLPISWSIL